MKKILISTGGSGGHVVPALNLYEHLKNNFDVKIYTDVRGAKYIPKNISKKKILNPFHIVWFKNFMSNYIYSEKHFNFVD